MECNRDEAARARCIAESKLEKREFTGAKKFALKAQALYPDMDGISQLMKTIDVYVSAENKVSGEVDWYGVLEVNPLADDETIRKQYRKLALLLHPDKNKSVGADGAFKLVSEAWNMLSDKAKRLAYNQRRGYKGVLQKVHMHSGGPSAAPRANGIFNFANRTTPVAMPPNRTTPIAMPPKHNPKPPNHNPRPPNHITKPSVNLTQKPPQQRSDTFWTLCRQCKMHYEYLKRYLNQTLLCPNCQGAFLASEIAPPQNVPRPSSQLPRQRQRNVTEYMPGRNAYNAGKHATVPQKPVTTGQAGSHLFRSPASQDDSISGASNAGTDPSFAAIVANVVQQAQDKLKRPCNESSQHMGWEAGMKKQKLDGEGGQFGINHHMPQRNGSFGTNSGIGLEPRIHGYSGPSRQSNSVQELTATETRNMIIAKVLTEIRNKLLSETNRVSSQEKVKIKRGKKVDLGSMCNAETAGGNRNGYVNNDSSSSDVADHPRSRQNTNKEDPSAASMNVPDPDFYDFDQDRAEKSFGDNEVWSAYDDDDGMPRFYALVNKVISRKPFKVRISWLNSKSNSEFSTIDWVGSGFYKTCGEFRVGRYETCKSLNSFSQKVNALKNARGSVLIYPRKGDAWALYKNWSSDWNEHTPDEIIHKYEMVSVLEDYNEEEGVLVSPLTKLPGFKTVFRPNMGPNVAKRIPRDEMFRFSHRVPYHLVTGLEAQNAPRGCLELDPAATPVELLEIVTPEVCEVPSVSENAKNTCAEGSRNSFENVDMSGTGQGVSILKAQ